MKKNIFYVIILSFCISCAALKSTKNDPFVGKYNMTVLNVDQVGDIPAVLIISKDKKLYISDVSKVLVSMYDGPEQIKKFHDMTKKANVPEDIIILRDRWYDKHNDFGVKLTNRAGTISTGDQEEVGKYKNCFYPTYQMLIDWNGNVYLCPQDWQRKVSMGNIMQETIFQVWTGKTITDYRKNLLSGKRCSGPCKSCNADGTLLGKNHAKSWNNIYKI